MMGRKFFRLKNLSIKNVGSMNVRPKHSKQSNVDSQTTTLLVPGLGGSGPQHWQSLWRQSRPGCSLVRQINWNLPDYQVWLTGLDAAIRACPAPPIVVAHSLGCALVAHWATQTTAAEDLVQGALMVAPADVDSDQHPPPAAQLFAPLPMSTLPVHATVVARTTDTSGEITPVRGSAHASGC